ncbi:hypothetical protein KHQ82_04630 [Mycoplasmatota bacterium]|nr:hypothetical protein KHQ82_04630 [Mycoplasmatota bacterium]
MGNKKAREIVAKYLGDLLKFTIDFKVNDRYKLTFLYEDEHQNIYEYKIIISCKTEDIEFIKHKGSTLRREIRLDQVPEFELEILKFMECNI